mgnify:CR=1 FL=1
MTTRKNYQIDEVLKALVRKNVKVSDEIIDISKADVLGNKSLGKIDFLISKGFFITGTGAYKAKYTVKEVERKRIAPKATLSIKISNAEANALQLAYGKIPNYCNIGPVNPEVFRKSSNHSKIIKKEKKMWSEAIKAGKFQKKLITIIKMTN